jgi:sulfofructose kinase
MVALGAICTTAIFQVDQIEAPPAKVMARNRCTVVDGMAISAACAFQKLGGQARVWARTGQDAEADAMRFALTQEGVDASGLHTVAGARSSHAAVIVDAQGQRLVVPFHDPQVDTSPHWLPLHQLAQTDLLHCDVRWPEGALAALHAAKALGILTMVDGDVAPQEVLQRLMPLADYCVFSDAGLRVYTGIADVQTALLQVAALGQNRHVGASCGADGYFWVQDGRIAHAPAPQVQVVDTLAAGDVFHGALALAILEGHGMAVAARFACMAASLKCTQFGGRLGCPSRAEVTQALQRER